MNRLSSLLFAALEAVLVVAIGIGILVVPLTVMWGFQYGLAFDWAIVWRASVDVWMLGHGVDLTVVLPPEMAAALALDGIGEPFRITITALGLTLLTILLGVRAGTRIADGSRPIIGLLGATFVYFGLSVALALTSQNPVAWPSIRQALVLPPLVFAVGLAIGALRSRGMPLIPLPKRFTSPNGTTWRIAVVAGISGGLMAVALVTAVSAVLAAILVAVGYSDVIRLYESLQAGVIGGVLLTILQLLLLPNVVIWVASWLIGPGFAIGTGSSVSPVGTQLGPIPAIPMFGAIPDGTHPFGFVGLLVPIIAGFLVGITLRSTARRLKEVWEVRVPVSVVLAVIVGLTASIVFGVLAAVSGGAVGPGRLADVGPDAWLVAGLVLLEVGIPAAIGLLPGGRDRDAKL